MCTPKTLTAAGNSTGECTRGTVLVARETPCDGVQKACRRLRVHVHTLSNFSLTNVLETAFSAKRMPKASPPKESRHRSLREQQEGCSTKYVVQHCMATSARCTPLFITLCTIAEETRHGREGSSRAGTQAWVQPGRRKTEKGSSFEQSTPYSVRHPLFAQMALPGLTRFCVCGVLVFGTFSCHQGRHAPVLFSLPVQSSRLIGTGPCPTTFSFLTLPSVPG
jgi:hypothetical protein